MSSLNLVLAGTPEFGLPCFEALRQTSHQIQAVYTQPDRLAGRGRTLHASPVKQWALDHQLPVYQPMNFKNEQTIEALAALKPDLMIVIAYGLILPSALLEIPRLGCINVHASLLPRWRGASPIQQAILHGDLQSGVTIMQMDVGLDTGAILKKASYTLVPSDTAQSLHDHLSQISVSSLLIAIDGLANQTLDPQVQENDLATYAPKINKEDARLDWQNSAVVLERQIRAFNPWPIAYTQFGEEVLRIHQAQVNHGSSTHAAGTILRINKEGILVASGQKQLLIEKIQFAGGKILSVAQWLNSGKTQLYEGLAFA